MIVLDYSASRLTGSAISGYLARGAIRYAGLSESQYTKVINRVERDSIINSGLSVALVYELSQSDAYGGYAAGQSNANKIKNHSASLGLPPRAFFCQDEHIASGQSANVLDYFLGAASVLGYANTGVYGFNDTMNLTKAYPFGAYWQCGAQKDIVSWATVYQRNYGAYAVTGTAVDVNDVLKADWLQSPQVQITHPEENDMQVIRCDELGLTGVLDGGRLRGVSAATDSANPAQLFPRFYVTKEDWQQLVDQSATLDNLTLEFDNLNGRLDALKNIVQTIADHHTTGTLSVSGQLNVS